MRVFMLGWEFPPYITGGLGTACHGLTRALSQQDVDVTFVLPRPAAEDADAAGGGAADHVRLLSPQSDGVDAADRPDPDAGAGAADTLASANEPGFENVTFRAVDAHFTNPYQRAQDRWAAIDRRIAAERAAQQPDSILHEPRAEAELHARPAARGLRPDDVYTGDLLAEAERYARLCTALARQASFDVVHAHDWLTFPAGMAVAGATGKPLVVHVHSTEFDRAGEQVHQGIYDIERRGLHAAARIITVSQITRGVLEHHYDVDPKAVEVIYNGVEPAPHHEQAAPAPTSTSNGEQVVLFLGRITMQKGPAYFVEAAKQVLEKTDQVKFIVAGAGDQVADIIDLAARHGIGHKFKFTGFLQGNDVDRIFECADVYVMPSVSEPFGLSALEAIRHDVPAIVSRTSGVSEALRHVLKVDFWNTREIADKILAVLNHPPLSRTLRRNADLELGRFTWHDAAARCQRVYRQAQAFMPE